MKPLKHADTAAEPRSAEDREDGTAPVTESRTRAPVGNQNGRKHGVYNTFNDRKRAAAAPSARGGEADPATEAANEGVKDREP
jgi:hypothetical protein